MFNELFDLYYNHIINNMINEDIYKYFINDMNNIYITNTSPARMVIDFIAGMTDDFFIEQHKKYIK